MDTWVIRAVYEEVCRQMASPGFPLHPEDNLWKTLRLDEDDLDWEIAEAVAQRTGRPLANYESNPYYEKVQTVGDLVMFFNAQPLQAPHI